MNADMKTSWREALDDLLRRRCAKRWAGSCAAPRSRRLRARDRAQRR